MKKITAILFILSVCGTKAHTDDSLYYKCKFVLAPKIPTIKDVARILYNRNFITTFSGAIDTVWQRIEDHPGKQDVITNPLFAAADGNIYMSSTRFGGFLTKIKDNGIIEWTLDRNFSGDTSKKYYMQFQDISELSNGDILVFGSEGTSNPSFEFLQNNVPNFVIISPNGVVKEEKTTRNLLKSTPNPRPIYKLFPETRLFPSYSKDSITLFSMDTTLAQVKSVLTFNNEYKYVPSGYRDPVVYDSNSFIFPYQGMRPKPDSVWSMIFLRFSNNYELLNRIILYTGAVADVAVSKTGEYFVVTRSTNFRVHITKLDRNGNVLWNKEPDNLKDFPFDILRIKKSIKGGFIITGELYQKNQNGFVDDRIEERTAFIGKLSEEGECEWYYTTGRKNFRNIIQHFAELDNGDIITVCNSICIDIFEETPMQITRLRPKATSVNEQPAASDGIELYPNPTSTSFTLSGVEGVASVRLVNSIGIEVKQFSILNSQFSIDMSGLANGLYFVNIRTATGATVKPIIVSH
jgi:hypothetical protein